MLTLGVTMLDTDIVIWFELATVGLAQAALEVIVQLTTSPLLSDEEVKVGLLVPTLVEPTFH